MPRKRFDQVSDVDTARLRAHHNAAKEDKGKDYTVPGLIALVGIVLITALYFNDGGTIALQASDDPSINRAGGAYANPYGDPTAAVACEPASYCDGSKLVRQHDDCSRFVVYCDYGCVQTENGAVCR